MARLENFKLYNSMDSGVGASRPPHSQESEQLSGSNNISLSQAQLSDFMKQASPSQDKDGLYVQKKHQILQSQFQFINRENNIKLCHDLDISPRKTSFDDNSESCTNESSEGVSIPKIKIIQDENKLSFLQNSLPQDRPSGITFTSSIKAPKDGMA